MDKPMLSLTMAALEALANDGLLYRFENKQLIPCTAEEWAEEMHRWADRHRNGIVDPWILGKTRIGPVIVDTQYMPIPPKTNPPHHFATAIYKAGATATDRPRHYQTYNAAMMGHHMVVQGQKGVYGDHDVEELKRVSLTPPGM